MDDEFSNIKNIFCNKNENQNDLNVSGNSEKSENELNRKRSSSFKENFFKKDFYSIHFNQYIYEFRDEILYFKENKEKEIVEIIKKFFKLQNHFLKEMKDDI